VECEGERGEREGGGGGCKMRLRRKKGERERHKKGKSRPPENRKPVQKPVQPVSGQTAQ
jgi:hypothetical protein